MPFKIFIGLLHTTSKPIKMKKIIPLLLLLTIGIYANAQEWIKYLPKNKSKQELTLFDYQKAFHEYEKSYNAKDGFYYENGVKKQLPDYTQFKRWEFDMEQRVNMRTGILPEKTDWDRLQEHKKLHPDLYRSTNGTWTSITPLDYTNWQNSSGLGRVTAIGFHPTDTNTFFVGAASGGLWRTTDGGQTYIPLTDTLGYETILKIYVPDNFPSTNTFYILAGQYSFGRGKIFKTTDGGQTWTMLSLGYDFPVPHTDPWSEGGIDREFYLMFDNDNPDIFYAKLYYSLNTYQQYNGWYKTTDGGDTWTALNHEIGRAFHPTNMNIQYYITDDGHFMKTTDGGNTWVQKYDLGYALPFPTENNYHISVSENQPDYVYFTTGDHVNIIGLYKSTDAGETFVQLIDNITGPNLYGGCNGNFTTPSTTGPSGYGELTVNPINADDLYVGWFLDWHSNDGGITWSSLCNNRPHPDKHYYGFQPVSNNFFEGNDGGVAKYDGVNWINLSKQLPISQIYRIGVAQNTQGEYLFGTQDNGTFYHSSGTGLWTEIAGGDGMDCAIDPNNDNIQYLSHQLGNFYRTVDKWVNSVSISDNYPSGFASGWVTPLELHPSNSNIFYILGNMLIKTVDAGNSYNQIGTGGKAFAVSPSNTNVIYKSNVITGVPTIYSLEKTTDGGNTWVEIIDNFNLQYDPLINYILFNSNNSDTVWVLTESSSQNNLEYGGVFKTNDGGQTWTDISAGLPDNRFEVLVFNKQYTAGSEIYLGTYGGGSYVKRDDENWVPYMTGLTSSPVMDMEIYYDTINPNNSKIRAGTYGRGLWESDLYTVIAPVAGFTANPLTGVEPLTVNFTDTSTNNPTSWAWDFGDGGTSTAQNPSYTYNTYGTYTVTLTATNSGGSGTEVKIDYINVTQPVPVADFTGTPTSGSSPLTVNFSDLSTNNPSSWAWDFGDGGTSTAQNPSYTYNVAGTYTVALIATNSGGSDTITKTNYIFITPPAPATDFSGTPTSGDSPLTVNFSDLSTNSPTSWAWDFGDGGTSTAQNPEYTYITPGTYTVTLTATNSGGSNTETKTDYITAAQPAPLADFLGTPTSGDAPLLVSFADESSNNPTSWEWDFGDGATSTNQNPNYTYTVAGVYTVTLTATNSGGSNTKTRNDYISVGVTPDPPVADFTGMPINGTAPLSVSFTDASSGSIDNWLWDFGDGNTSTEQNPNYTYNSPGTYTVSLTVNGPGGEDTETKTDYISVAHPVPVADFSGTPTSGEFPLQVNFTDQTSGEVNSWNWYFGDNNTSVMQNPVHIFDNAGNYTVSLKVTGPGGSDSVSKANYINVIVDIKEYNSDVLNIYPNPCHEQFTIKSAKNISSIILLNDMGNVVQNKTVRCLAPCEQVVNMSKLANGIYLLRLETENNNIVIMRILKN